jgi:hypothetical protein
VRSGIKPRPEVSISFCKIDSHEWKAAPAIALLAIATLPVLLAAGAAASAQQLLTSVMVWMPEFMWGLR